MSDKMTEKNKFTLWEYPNMVSHFEYMAQQGWMLTGCTESRFEYVKSQPCKMHFAVTFFPDYDFLDPNPPEKLERLWDFCSENGWRHITDSASMQVFCNGRENSVPLHTDAVVQLENFHSMINAAKLKNWRQEVVINGGFIVFLAVVAGIFIKDTSFAHLVEKISVISLLIVTWYTYKCISAVCGLAAYYSWYRKAAVQAREKDIFLTFMPDKIWANADGAISTFFLCGMAILLVKNGEIASTFLFSIPFIILFFIIYALSKYMRDNGVSAKTNRKVTYITAAVIILLFVMALPYIFMTIADMGLGGDFITVTRTYPT
ncbi:MAG: DUF2812 domain-containing protein [Ruminococcaceae bacterium]|nr:DUF2812 domain-containing protein [Oscillospiraceae bacterium]